MTIGLGYKIIPFLTWTHRYASLVGKQPVPGLAELLPSRLPQLGLAAWNLGLLGLCAAVWFGMDPGVKQTAGLLMGIGSLAAACSLLYVLRPWVSQRLTAATSKE